jgi:hypothetical protein
MKKAKWALAAQKTGRMIDPTGRSEGKEQKRSSAAAAVNSDVDVDGADEIKRLTYEELLSFQAPSNIYLSDNERWERLLRPWCAPGTQLWFGFSRCF